MENNQTIQAPEATEATKETKVKTVINNMDSRRVFPTLEAALAYMQKMDEEISDFSEYSVAAPGVNEEGQFDPAIYGADSDTVVSVLTQRGEGSGDAYTGTTVKAIVVYPKPKLETIIAAIQAGDEGATAWLTKTLETELNHVAVRALRKADDVADVIEQMPVTLADYTTSNRESSGGILAAFDETWKAIKEFIGSKNKSFRLANLSRKELRKAMESASYAATIYPHLEDRGEGRPSLFETAAKVGQQLAKSQSLDATIFDRMLATRADKIIDVDASDDDEEIDFNELEAELAAATAPEAEAPAAE